MSTIDAAPLNQLQISEAARGRVTLDRTGRFAIHGGIASGRGFTGGWNTTGLGAADGTHDLSLKQLYASIQPFHRLEFAAGGLYLARGVSGEATSYDADGYLVGQRALIRRAIPIVIDRLTITRGYLGDLAQANVFHRLRRLDRANFYQALAERDTRHAVFSIDYTIHDDRHVLRAATSLAVTGRVLDRVRIEAYERIGVQRAGGYAVTVQRTTPFGTMTTAGLSSIDANYGPFNGDLYGRGRRVFWTLSKRLGATWLASAQVAHGVGRDSSPPRTRFDLSLACDVLRAWTSGRQ